MTSLVPTPASIRDIPIEDAQSFSNVGLWLLGYSWQAQLAHILEKDRRRIVHYHQATSKIPYEVWSTLRTYAEHRLAEIHQAIAEIDKCLANYSDLLSGKYILSILTNIPPSQSQKSTDLNNILKNLGLHAMEVDDHLNRNGYLHFYAKHSLDFSNNLMMKLNRSAFTENSGKPDAKLYEDMVNIVRICNSEIPRFNENRTYQVFINDAGKAVSKSIDRNHHLWNIKNQLPR